MPIIRDAVCTACGCTCNDIALRVENDRVVEAKNACSIIGQDWFKQSPASDEAACYVERDRFPLEAGIAKAAELLLSARYPLIYGLRHGTTESQRLAVEIAELVGGVIDTPTSARRGAPSTTFRGVGEVTCTLGEVRHRSDLIVFWNCGDLTGGVYPRHLELYSALSMGEFVPGGLADRRCVVVSSRANTTLPFGNTAQQLKPDSMMRNTSSFLSHIHRLPIAQPVDRLADPTYAM